jgi:hypothetical protein
MGAGLDSKAFLELLKMQNPTMSAPLDACVARGACEAINHALGLIGDGKNSTIFFDL